MLAQYPLETPLANAEMNGFHVVSGGQEVLDESIITTAYKNILDWFETIIHSGDYCHPDMVIPEELLAEQRRMEELTAGPVWEGDALQSS